MIEKDTTIRVKKDTVQRLKAKGKFGESYEDIIKRLIDAWEKRHRSKKPKIIPVKIKK